MIEKVEKYTDLYLTGLDVEGYPAQHEVNICNVCHAVVSVAWDHWEKHVEWHEMNNPMLLAERLNREKRERDAQG